MFRGTDFLSEAQTIGIPAAARADSLASPRARDAIARASQATGVDFNFLLAQARLESSLDPTARASTSSAAGLYQFTRGTWLAALDRHGAEHGMGWADTAISGGRVTDPSRHAEIMALRYDPDASALMAAELAKDNRTALVGTLGREPDATELYLAHFLGADGASRFLSALDADPTQSAAAVLPSAAASNRAIFFEGGAPRSVGEVMELMRGKLSAAMGAPDTGGSWGMQSAGSASSPGGPISREFQAASVAAAQTGGRSMSETLRNTFALQGDSPHGSAPDFVRAAYGKLQAFGL